MTVTVQGGVTGLAAIERATDIAYQQLATDIHQDPLLTLKSPDGNTLHYVDSRREGPDFLAGILEQAYLLGAPAPTPVPSHAGDHLKEVKERNRREHQELRRMMAFWHIGAVIVVAVVGMLLFF